MDSSLIWQLVTEEIDTSEQAALLMGRKAKIKKIQKAQPIPDKGVQNIPYFKPKWLKSLPISDQDESNAIHFTLRKQLYQCIGLKL